MLRVSYQKFTNVIECNMLCLQEAQYFLTGDIQISRNTKAYPRNEVLVLYLLNKAEVPGPFNKLQLRPAGHTAALTSLLGKVSPAISILGCF